MESKYPMYFAFALASDDVERERERDGLAATSEQIMRLVDGRPDISNEATFKVTVKEVPATEEILMALMALNMWDIFNFSSVV